MKALVSIRRTVAILVTAVTLGIAINAQAAGEGVALDNFPVDKLTELPSLQDGAATFVNYCLNCHGASMMRYNRLRDIGLTEDQIENNLMFTGEKVGDPMTVTLRPEDAKAWFGTLPPDLSLVGRSRSSASGSGSDWIYTYLRSYYRDNTAATGWNNAVFPNTSMPHVLYELQGSRGAVIEEVKAVHDEKTDGHGYVRTVVTIDEDGNRTAKTERIDGGHPHEGSKLTLTHAKGGTLSQAAYDEKVANLVGFLTYVADPSAKTRLRMGVWVMMFLGLLIFLTWWLNREYWKDIK
jgi:ubiquinol-cytochrome c reductase cytochrome c1 subunit